MEKLTNDQMENLLGGDCFVEALEVEIKWDSYQNNPSDVNFAAWVISWANLINCAQA